MSRKIEFPDNVCLGEMTGIGKSLPAQGKVTVPKGKRAGLTLSETTTDLSPLANLGPDDLQVLWFHQKNTLAESQLDHLRALHGLEQLSVVGQQFTDLGLDNLADLRNLITLSLSDTQFTGSGKLVLNRMSKLLRLYISRTAFSDAACQTISGLANLQILDLAKTKVTDDGLAMINNLPSLEDMDLSNTFVRDAGMASLSGFRALKDLRLFGTQISDACIPVLSQLPLRRLNISRTSITASGIAQLKLAMRKCEISH